LAKDNKSKADMHMVFWRKPYGLNRRDGNSARRIVGLVSQRQVHMNELSYVTVSGSGYIWKSKSIK
jgi:hypothetical protein